MSITPDDHTQPALAAVSRIAQEVDDVTEMDWAVNVEKLDPLDAARIWTNVHADRMSTGTKD